MWFNLQSIRAPCRRCSLSQADGTSHPSCWSLTFSIAPRDDRTHVRYLQRSLYLNKTPVSLSLDPVLSSLCSSGLKLPSPLEKARGHAVGQPSSAGLSGHWPDEGISVRWLKYQLICLMFLCHQGRTSRRTFGAAKLDFCPESPRIDHSAVLKSLRTGSWAPSRLAAALTIQPK